MKSIIDDAESLNLDIAQQREANNSMRRSDETVELRMKEAYCWLLVPIQDGSNPIEWEKTRISGGSETHIIKASKNDPDGTAYHKMVSCSPKNGT